MWSPAPSHSPCLELFSPVPLLLLSTFAPGPLTAAPAGQKKKAVRNFLTHTHTHTKTH